MKTFLGAYFFRVPEVHLHWMVIGLLAGPLGITVESLTVVVATHELAHAYSHLGRDIEGKRWETEAFARADLSIVEGVAQFYTEVVSRKLESRNPAVLPTYQKLVAIQEGPYRIHEQWAKRKSAGKDTPMPQAGEIVRVTLVQWPRRQRLQPVARFPVRLEAVKYPSPLVSRIRLIVVALRSLNQS